MSKPNTYANRFITRMDYKSSGTYGWWVRFVRDNVLVAGKFFADRKHGGKNKALKQARAWRDEHNNGEPHEQETTQETSEACRG